MTDFEITRINKPHHLRAHEHITHIGNLAGDWRLTRESAIARITVEASASTLLISRPDATFTSELSGARQSVGSARVRNRLQDHQLDHQLWGRFAMLQRIDLAANY